MATMKTLNGFGFNATEFNGKTSDSYLLKTDTVANSADSQKLGGKAPEYYLNPKNLLYNSDFLHPVNRRGKTSYTAQGYTIDRWYSNNADKAITLSNTGITLSTGSTLFQKLDLIDALAGKTITAAVYFADGTIAAKSGISTNNGAYTPIVDVTQNNMRIRVYEGADGYIRFQFDANANINLQWAALYEGSYTADNVPPPFFYPQRLEMLNLGLPVQPRNLLDNSDFKHLVNQRGITSETSVSAYSYFIDRWVNQSNEARSFTLSTSGIGLLPPTTLLQKIEKIEAGKIVTFAIKLSDGTIATLTGTVQYTSDGSWTRFASISHSFGDMYMETMNGFVNVVVYNTETITIEWAALYEGSYTADTLPPYVPKGYAAELAECQRYYYTIKSDGSSYAAYATGVMNNVSSAYFPIAFPIPMRIAPTLSYFGNFRVYVNSAGRSITDMENNAQSRYSSRIIINNIGDGVLGQACELQSSGDGTAFIAFSADL